MSAQFQSPATTESEPTSTLAAVPVWLIVMALVLVYWGAVYFDKHGGWFSPKVYGPYASIAEVEIYQPRQGGDEIRIRRGQAVFELTCAPCHNPDGMGKPNQAPPLAGSEWVQVEKPERLIRIPLYGLNGPITVKEQQMTFPAGMLAIGWDMPEDDLAAVLTYIRQAWGNKASRVTAEQVKAVKAQVGKRGPPTPEELMTVPAK